MKSKSMTAVEPGQNPFPLGKVILAIVLLGVVLVCIGIRRQHAPKSPDIDSITQSAVSTAQHLATKAPGQNLKTNRATTMVAAKADRPLTSNRPENPAAAYGTGSPVARQL